VFEVDTTVRGGHLVLAVAGEVDLASAPSFRRAAIEAAGDAGRVVVDLTACDHLDSVGVGLLLGLHKRLRERSGSLVVVCPEPRVRRVLELTEVDRIITVVDRIDDAVEPVAPTEGLAPTEGR
jgi:anti-sigma B factor antagonist